MAGANPQMLIRIAANLEKLKANLAEGKGQIEVMTAGMQKFAASLDGSKLEQKAHNITAAINSVGGASKLTDAEARRLLPTLDAWIAKGERMGKEIPPDILKTRDALQAVDDAAKKGAGSGTSLLGTLTKIGGAIGIAFSVGAIKSFVGSVFDAAGEIHDVASSLGISTDAMQGFKFAAEQGGSSLDAVGTAIGKMNQNLGGGDKATVKALKDAGLGFQAIRNMKPEDAFLAIADAIQKIEDPMKQVDIGRQLLGKGFDELLPAIKDGFRGVSESADKMSAETIASLEAAGDAWEKLKNRVVIITGTIIASAMDAANQTTKSWSSFMLFAEEVIKFGAGAAVANAKMREEADRGGKTTKDIYLATAGAVHQTAEQLAAIEAAAKKAAAAAEKYAEVVRDIAAASVPLTLTQREQVLAMDKLGISTSKMAEYLKISEVPIKNFNDALKEQAKVIAEIGKHIKDLPHNVQLRLDSTSLAGAAPTIDVKAVRKANEDILSINEATFYGIEARMKAMGVNTSAELGRLAARAREQFETMKASGMFTADELAAAWKRAQEAMDKALGNTGGLFGSLMADLGKIPGMLIAAFTGGGGGGGAAKGVGSMLGATLGTHLADSLKKTGAKMFQGALGDVFSQAIPVIGSLIGPLAGALWNKLFGTAGRDAVKDFAATFKGGFDGPEGLHAELNALGAEGERLWIKLTQGTGRNNPAQAKATIDEITAALARQKEKTADVAAAAEASAAAQQAALDAISEKYSGAISKLEAEYKSLSDSVSAEAQEEFMGIIETQERARMQQIEAEKKAQEMMRDAEIEAKQATFDEMLEAGKVVDEEIRKIWGKTHDFPYRFVPENSPGGFAPGEAIPPGASAFASSRGASGGFGGSASASSHGAVTIPVILQVDGREFARNQVRYTPGVLTGAGR